MDADEEAARFAAHVEAWLEAMPGLGNPYSREAEREARARTLAAVIDQARRSGQPVVRGRWDGDCIVLEMARPAGYG